MTHVARLFVQAAQERPGLQLIPCAHSTPPVSHTARRTLEGVVNDDEHRGRLKVVAVSGSVDRRRHVGTDAAGSYSWLTREQEG